MVEGDLGTLLGAVAGIDGNAWGNVAPDNQAAPYIVYSKVIGLPDNTLDADIAGTERARFQIDVYGGSYAEAKTIYGAVKAAMSVASAFKAIELENQDLFESDTKLHRVRCDWSIRP